MFGTNGDLRSNTTQQHCKLTGKRLLLPGVFFGQTAFEIIPRQRDIYAAEVYLDRYPFAQPSQRDREGRVNIGRIVGRRAGLLLHNVRQA